MRIKVIHIPTGQEGSIEDKEFNPSMFKKVEEPKKKQATLGNIGDIDPSDVLAQTAMATEKRRKSEETQGKIFEYAPVAGQIAGGLVGGIGGAALGGAIGEGARQFQKSEDMNVGNIAKEAALGAGGEVVGLAIAKYGPKLLSGAINKVKSVPKGVSEAVSKEAVQGITQTNPTQFLKLSERGMDLNQVVAKHYPKGMGIDDVIGGITEKGKGGIFKTKLDDAEKIIQSTVKGASDVTIPVDDFVAQLNKEAVDLAKVAGNESQSKALKAFAKNTATKYKKGLTPKDMLEIKRAVDSKFGQAVLKKQTGSTAAQAQKAFGNWTRDQLKTLFPEIAEQLDTQSELLTLQPILNRSRSISQTQGSLIRKGTLNAIDVSRPFGVPGQVVDVVMNDPARASKFLQTMKTPKPVSIPQLPSAIGGALPPLVQGGIGLASRGLPNISLEQGLPQDINQGGQIVDTTQQEQAQPQIQEQIDHAGSIQQNFITGYSPEDLYQGYMKATAAGDKKAASQLRQLFMDEKDYQKTQGKTAKPKSAAATQVEGKANAGLSAISKIESMLSADPSVLIKAAIPGSPGARQYEAAVSSLTDAIGGLRTGASVSKEQQAFYRQMLPQIGDSMETIKYKIDAVRKELEGYASANIQDTMLPSATETGLPDISQY